MKMLVDTGAAVPIKGNAVLLQNLGPGNLTFGRASDVTDDEGVMLAPDETLALPAGGKQLYVTSDANDTDLRVL